MKTIYQAISIVLVALFASCNSDETNAPATPSGMTPVRFQAAVDIDDKTRANIDVDGDRFTGTWEEGDAMGVLYSVPGSSAFSEPGRFVYNDNAFAFEGELPTATGEWQYMAFYPHAAVSGNTASIPFGNLRSQKGSEFNCASDALVAEMLGFSNAKQGETDEGEPVKFRLNRLTSILNLSVQGGAGAGDAVRHILLTSENDGQPLSAQSIDFDISTLGADVALNAGARSNVIALGFDPGTAPAADAFEAYFNILPGNYDRLTFDVITEAKQIGTVTVTRDDPGRKFAAGMLYRKEAADITFRPAEAPSLNWPDRELNDVHEITVDGNEILTYSAAITIDAPAGIAGLRIEVTSEFLNDMMGITGMDIFNDEAIQSNIGELPFSELELACTTQVQYKKSTVFDITRLLPMILMGGAENSLHVFEVHVTDLAGQETVQPLTFKVPESAPAPAEVVYNNDADLWTNTATLTVSNAALAASVLEYRAVGDEGWQTASLTANEDGTLTATIAPTWTPVQNGAGQTVQAVDSKTGVFAQKEYQYQLLVNETKAAEGTFTPANNSGDAIPVLATDLSCFTTDNTAAAFWGSGNNSMASKLCTFSSPYAYMQANEIIGILAPGNLFTGTFTFVKQGILGATSYGTVGFGQKYTYTARPTALQLNYKASFGSKICTKYTHENELKEGDHDQASVMVCIINWDARHGVTSGNNGAPTGSWDPESLTGLSDAEKAGLIAYGAAYPDQDAANDTLLTIPLNYYDKDAGIPTGNYTIIISCSSSRYGDYLNGSKNSFYVKDFQWVY